MRNYFNFTKGERNAFLVLLVITLVISLFPLFPFRRSHPVQTDFSLLKELQQRSQSDSGNTEMAEESENFRDYPDRISIASKFRFDPNIVTSEQLRDLGFSRSLAERLIKFRNAGGKFYVRSDISKIYGMDPGFVKELMPYIDLPDTREYAKQESNPGFQKQAKQLIDINTADTATLNRLKGIGHTLSLRIVSFRDKLGGFYSLEQLNEVYGLKPEVIEVIKPKLDPELSPVKLIDINAATREELGKHPYIRKNLAEVIVNYRIQHGRFESVNDLLKIKVLDENTFIRLKNYLKV